VNRAERRRRERAGRKTPVLIAGDGIVAASLGHRYEARPHAELPPKVAGKHRWVATGAWVLSDNAVEGAHDPDLMKFLDNENLMSLSLGCWDCERPLGVITVDSFCPADGAE
jgi:hypothetical protein